MVQKFTLPKNRFYCLNLGCSPLAWIWATTLARRKFSLSNIWTWRQKISPSAICGIKEANLFEFLGTKIFVGSLNKKWLHYWVFVWQDRPTVKFVAHRCNKRESNNDWPLTDTSETHYLENGSCMKWKIGLQYCSWETDQPSWTLVASSIPKECKIPYFIKRGSLI